jgi:hypoxia up-regulated 1
MIEENIAASITYGIDRIDENATHSVLFLNLGSTKFEATVVKYYAKAENVTSKYGSSKIGDIVENIEVISQAITSEISGRQFDIELVNILSEHFNSMKSRQGKPDIRETPRIVNRLFKEVQKIKETLSANKEKIVNIPEVADYETLHMTVTREMFETKIEAYMKYLEEAVSQALEKANMQINDLDGVEIIGGAIRVPKVKEFLSTILGEEKIGSHINGDESMTFGAAFIGANATTAFKVKKLFLHNHR